MTLALEGIRVLDLSRLGPGPFCTMILADMGAEVIKVEEPEERAGSFRDIFTPPSATREEEEKSLAYNFLARNKKSIALNLRLTEARDIFYQLVPRADVVFEGYRPGIVKRLGVDYETISGLNPRVVYCSISGFGQDGPYRDLPGHDPNYCAIAGPITLNLDREDNPMIIGVPVADIGVALHAVIGILCALIARDRTGRGQYIDISFTDSAMDFTSFQLGEYLKEGVVSKKFGMPSSVNVLPTKDGKFIVTGTAESYFWERFCRALGREDLIPYQGAQGEKLEEVLSIIEQVTRTKTRDEWFQIMREADTCVTPLLTFDELVTNPQLLHRQMILELEHPTEGRVRQLGMAIKLSETPGQFRSFAPHLGQHTEEILQDLGYSQQRIEELRQAAAIK